MSTILLLLILLILPLMLNGIYKTKLRKDDDSIALKTDGSLEERLKPCPPHDWKWTKIGEEDVLECQKTTCNQILGKLD